MPISPESENAYRILGLESGATPLEIRRAYRERVKEWHPDRFTGDPVRRREAEEKMKALNAAYATLRALNPSFHVHARRARQRVEDAPPPAPSPYESVYCLHCRASMPFGSGVCPHCGEDQRDALMERKNAQTEAVRRRADERRAMRRSRWGRRGKSVGAFLGDAAIYLLWAGYVLLRLLIGR